jgi:hypothetical protein
MNNKGVWFLALSVAIFGYVLWNPRFTPSTISSTRQVTTSTGQVVANTGQAEPICVGEHCKLQAQAAMETARVGITWPPRLGAAFPDLELMDSSGQRVRLSSFKGKLMLFEPIGMTCPACQAFTGAHRVGSLGAIAPQQGLASIEELFPKYTRGLSLTDDRIVFVQLILYNMSMNAPSIDDVRAWANHFRMNRSSNFVVLAGTKHLVGQASADMIPGFQLVDRNFVLRADATGHQPRHRLFDELLPMVPQLLSE